MRDRKRPGRPRDPPAKHASDLGVMVIYICMRWQPKEGRSVRAAARHVSQDSPQQLSVRQLERLYARHGPELELQFMRKNYKERWQGLYDRAAELVASDDRAATIARHLVRGIPLRRWRPAELEELLLQASLLDHG